MPAHKKRAPDLITDGCESSYRCWELNSDLWKTSQCSQPLSHLSSLVFVLFLRVWPEAPDCASPSPPAFMLLVVPKITSRRRSAPYPSATSPLLTDAIPRAATRWRAALQAAADVLLRPTPCSPSPPTSHASARDPERVWDMLGMENKRCINTHQTSVSPPDNKAESSRES
ncbi:hypothetical protein ACRRTK_004083 [Alexandromys fortis]